MYFCIFTGADFMLKLENKAQETETVIKLCTSDILQCILVLHN